MRSELGRLASAAAAFDARDGFGGFGGFGVHARLPFGPRLTYLCVEEGGGESGQS